MTTNPLPDLSKWHEVPAAADITSPVPVAVLRQDGSWFLGIGPLSAQGRAPELRYFTADPIPAPRPAPPTEPGTVLLDVTMMDGRTLSHLFLADASRAAEYPWVGAVGYSYDWFATDDLVSWTVADVTPRTNPETIPEWERELLAKGAPDPLDESDHRDRRAVGKITGRITKLTRTGDGLWANSGARAIYTLQEWATAWDVRFADEVHS